MGRPEPTSRTRGEVSATLPRSANALDGSETGCGESWFRRVGPGLRCPPGHDPRPRVSLLDDLGTSASRLVSMHPTARLLGDWAPDAPWCPNRGNRRILRGIDAHIAASAGGPNPRNPLGLRGSS